MPARQPAPQAPDPYVETVYVDPDDLHAYPGNPNQGDVAAVRASVRRNGQYAAVTARRLPDGTLQLLAGHTTTEATGAEVGKVRVEVIDADDATARRIVTADNQTARLATMDETALLALLDQAKTDGGLDGTGFGADAYADLEEAVGRASTLGRNDPDDAPPRPDPDSATTRPGDVWLLGPHRLLAGDATQGEDVARLLDGDRAALVFTDPPYGVSVQGRTQDRLTIINDDLPPEALRDDLLVPAFRRIRDNLQAGRAFYICAPSGLLEQTFREAMDDAGLLLRQQVVWVKDQFVLGRQDYQSRHESVLYGWDEGGSPPPPPDADSDLEPAEYDTEHGTLLYGWREGSRHTWRGGRRQSTVWEFPRPRASKLHPTMKPVGLVARALLNSSRPGEVVLDLFGGAGSTLIAAHRTSRIARILELDVTYTDVICRRYQEHTGVVPVLEATGRAVDFTDGSATQRAG